MTTEPAENTRREPRYESEVGAYRQPMVTSLGIILGFLLAFLANWAKETDNSRALLTLADFAVLVSAGCAVILSTIVLYRLLDNRIYSDPGRRYQITFRIYITAIVLPLIGMAVALVL